MSQLKAMKKQSITSLRAKMSLFAYRPVQESRFAMPFSLSSSINHLQYYILYLQRFLVSVKNTVILTQNQSTKVLMPRWQHCKLNLHSTEVCISSHRQFTVRLLCCHFSEYKLIAKVRQLVQITIKEIQHSKLKTYLYSLACGLPAGHVRLCYHTFNYCY